MTSDSGRTRGNLMKLFFSMLYISAFTFGGGFVIVSFMKKHFVEKLHWIENDEMLDMVALAQTSPGAIAVNAAILVGWRTGGFAGMLTAVLGTIIPPIAIISIISIFYAAFAANQYVALALNGMRAGVAAVIFDVALGMGAGVLAQKSVPKTVLLAAAFAAAFIFDVNAVLIVITALTAGIAAALFNLRRRRPDDIH